MSTYQTRGYQNQKHGKNLEDWVQKNLERIGWAVVRIHDGCRSTGARKLIRVAQSFDFIAYSPCGRVVSFDLKSRSVEKLTPSVCKTGKSTKNQCAEFERIRRVNSTHIVGFLFYLSQEKNFYFVEDFKNPNETKVFWGSIEKGLKPIIT